MYCMMSIVRWKKKKFRVCDYDSSNGVWDNTFDDTLSFKRIWDVRNEIRTPTPKKDKT
jgi:hypothetical protein